MRKIKKKCFAIGLSLALAVSAVWQGMPVLADEYPADEVNSEQMSEKERMDLEIASKAVNNYQDVDEEPPTSVSEYKDDIPQNYATKLDEKYDPRKDEDIASKIPAVRNQNPLGTCWAHSAMAMVEMSLLKQDQLPLNEDMSEFQTVFFMNHDWADPLGLCDGDNFHVVNSGSTALASDWYTKGNNTTYTKFMLMDWVGAVSEVKEPDTKYNILTSQKGNAHLDNDYAINKDTAHVQDVYVINSKDKDIMKQMILQYGAVGISYYDDNTYYNANKAAYYNNVNNSTNHAVTAVGWDDTFSASNFKTAPPSDGAWLIRNSWGDWYGDGGYFWISYYDTSLSSSAYAVNAISSEDKENYYDYNYQYDGGISLNGIGINSEVEEANVFTAKGKEVLKAVAIYTNANYDYDIKIYKNLTDKNDPVSGTEVTGASVSGTQLFEGYHTVELGENVDLASGEVFSVVVTLKNNNSNYTNFAIDGDFDGGWIYSDADAQEGQSFYRAAGSSSAWTDLGVSRQANLRIKAYTINGVENPITSIDITKSEHTMDAGDTYNLSDAGNITVQPANSDDTIIYSSDNESVATVATSGAITAVRPGDATITASAFAGTGKDSIKIHVSLNRPAESVTLSEDELRLSIGSTKKIEAVLIPDDTDDYVIWTASGSAVATVDEDGNVTGVGEGSITITATTISGMSASCVVNVQSRAGEVIECTFDKLPKKLYKYNTYKISLSNAMKKLSPEKITWTMGKGTPANIKLTPVGENGKDGCELYVNQVASAKNKGEKLRLDAVVTYIKTSKRGQTEKTKTYKRASTSYNMSYDIEIDRNSISFTDKKASTTLSVSFNEGKSDDQPTNTKLKWMVTDSTGKKDKNGSRVISVNNKGVVKPKGPGITYVTVFAADSYDKPSKSYKVKDTIKVTCVPVTTVKFSPASISLKPTETVNLREKIVFNGGVEPFNKDKMKLKWSSSSKKNISVNGKGVAKVAKKAVSGTYTIKVQATGGVQKGQTVPEATVNIVVQE